MNETIWCYEIGESKLETWISLFLIVFGNLIIEVKNEKNEVEANTNCELTLTHKSPERISGVKYPLKIWI